MATHRMLRSLLTALLATSVTHGSAAHAAGLRERIEARMAKRASRFIQETLKPAAARRSGDRLLALVGAATKSPRATKAALLLDAELSVAFAFAFKEEQEPEQALALYRRARDDARRALGPAWKRLERAAPGELPRLLEALHAGATAPVFWAAFAEALSANLARDGASLVRVPRLKQTLTWVARRDSRIFNAGPHLALGLLAASFPASGGGDLDEARRHFERVDELTEERWLIGKLLRARSYSVALQLPPLGQRGPEARARAQKTAWDDFTSNLEHIVHASDKLWPSRGLYNAVAKEKALKMLRSADDWMLPPPGARNRWQSPEKPGRNDEAGE
jgi:hypothetical protein